MNQRKKKAFTLTELLVVVVIIGVLAAVILPKFNKVMETRKTTEAEELMAAVRTEQEYRCAIDKPYIGDMEKLSDIIPNASTKNFNYSLETTGMLASSKGKYSYELKMPSYADGRVCCEGAGCTQLNKDYPTCAELQTKPDYQVSTECTATQTAECQDGAEKKETCNGCGTRVTQRCVSGKWTAVNENCSKTEEDCVVSNSCTMKSYPGTKTIAEKFCGTKSETGRVDWPWQYHEGSWYNGKTWKTNPTECCDPKEECPAECEPGQVRINNYVTANSLCCATPCPSECEQTDFHRRSGVKYEEDGPCCAGSCREVCGGSGYSCPNINGPLTQASKENGMNRRYWYEAAWESEPWEWFYSKEECYRCPRELKPSSEWKDYKDEHGNVINKGLDLNDCSTSMGCPTGYEPHPSKEYVCLKKHQFIPKEHWIHGVIVFGDMHISTVDPAVMWYETGSVVREGRCLRLKNATGVFKSAGPGKDSTRCSSYGGPEAYCKAVCNNVSTCTAGPCYADDTEYDGASATTLWNAANHETTWTNSYTGESFPAGPRADGVPTSCCHGYPPDDLSLGTLTAGGCKQPHNVRIFSMHYFGCVAAD